MCNWGWTLKQSSAVHIQASYLADGILLGSSSKLRLLVINLASVPGGQLVNSPTAQSLERYLLLHLKSLITHIALFCLTILVACNQAKQYTPAETTFVIETTSLQMDTIIKAAVLIDGYIICLRDNNKFLVLDSNFKQIDSIAERLNKLHPTVLFWLNNKAIIGSIKKNYFINENLVIQEYIIPELKYDLPLYFDSTYYVYGCCAGEWGGSVFFLNKETNKTYSYPATCVRQVLKFKDNYIVCNNFYSTDFLSIKDPSKLFELKEEKQKRNCNWYMEVDSLKDYKIFDSIIPEGVVKYSDSSKARYPRTMMTFEYKNELYSIISTDSLTLIEKHLASNLVVIDTLRKQRTRSDYEKIIFTKEGAIMAYGNTWSSGTTTKMNRYVSSGLVLVKGNRIRFLEFKTPYSWTESNSR